jgi:hypothetical protein
MSYTSYTAEEIGDRGRELYEHQLRAKVEAENVGRFLVIDIESGDYEIDDEDLVATDRLLARRPQAITYGLCIGYPDAYRFSAGRALSGALMPK